MGGGRWTPVAHRRPGGVAFSARAVRLCGLSPGAWNTRLQCAARRLRLVPPRSSIWSICANCYNGLILWFRLSARSIKRPSCARCRVACTLPRSRSPAALMAAPAGPPLSLHIAIVMRRKPPLNWVIHGRFRSAGHQIGWRALVPSALVRVKPVRRSGMFRSVVTVMSPNGRKLLVRGAGLLKRTARLFRRPLFSDSVIQDTTP